MLSIGLLTAQLQSPEQVFGFKVGSDRKLADYSQMLTFYKQLANNSDRVILKEIGKSSEGQPMILLFISTAENLSQLDKWKKIFPKYDCLLSSVEHKQNFYFKNKTINFKRTPWPRSQDLKPLVSLSFAINILSRSNMIKWGSCVGKKPYFFHINSLLSTDIDDMNSFQLAEIIYRNKKLVKKLL